MSSIRCPVCKKPKERFEDPSKFLPFCSVRCKQVDLGKWVLGDYVVSRSLGEDEQEEFEDELERRLESQQDLPSDD